MCKQNVNYEKMFDFISFCASVKFNIYYCDLHNIIRMFNMDILIYQINLITDMKNNISDYR